MPVDHTFFESGSIRYHVEASASDPENVFLSISTPSLSYDYEEAAAAPSSSRLPELTLQEARKTYHRFAEGRVRPDAQAQLLRPHPAQRWLASTRLFGGSWDWELYICTHLNIYKI
jgi:hypothetical protein